jgi:hypothetical protein
VTNHGLTTTHRIPSTAGAGSEPRREVNTLPPKPEPAKEHWYDHADNIVDWSMHFDGLGRE